MYHFSSQHNWDQYWDQKRDVDEVYSNVDRIVSQLKRVIDLKGKKILEVGAGTGRDSIPMIDEGADVYVLDYSPSAMKIISRINEQIQNRIHPIRGNALSIPVRDNSFDIVFHQGLLEHFRDPMSVLRENIRVLKHGGLLLVDVPQTYHIYTIVKHVFIWLNQWFAGWETQFTIRELKHLVEQSGSRVIFQYGDWKRPSLGYRIMRELLLKLHIRLPLYPKGWKPIKKIRTAIRKRFIRTKLAFYTFIDIGVIARKM